MPNPKAPKGDVRRAAETEAPIERVVKRLADLGAPAEALAEIRAGWADDEEWEGLTEAGRDVPAAEARQRWLGAVDGMTDDQLRELFERAAELDDDEPEPDTSGSTTVEDGAETGSGQASEQDDGSDSGPSSEEAKAEPEPEAGDAPDPMVKRLEEADAEELATMPAGPVGAVLDWVGTDRARAVMALNHELAKPEPERRSTLVRPLEAMLDGADGSTG